MGKKIDYNRKLNPIYIESIEANHIYINDCAEKTGKIVEYKIGKNWFEFQKLKTRKAVLTDSLFLRFINSSITRYSGDSCRDFIVVKFNYDAEYKINNVGAKVDKHDLRKLYYVDGVTYTFEKKNKQGEIVEKVPVHYKMLMRSPGKAKNGECVFIRDSLHHKAINFLTMGLYDKMDEQSESNPEKVFKLVEMSAYLTLTTASAIGYIQIPLENILIDYLDACISYYKELVSLYDSFSGDKLTNILTDLDDNALAEKADVYQKYLNTLQDKNNTTLSEMNEYRLLLDALDTNDFESSMDVFNKALESYKASGDTAMADKLQSVLDLLNERAIDAVNWGEFADQWAEEWEKAFAAAKQELIGTAKEIQEVNDALREIRFENITNAINELDTAKGILSSIADLIQDDLMYDDGELSEYGRAKVALLVSQLKGSQKKANAYLDLISEIQNNRDTYASDKAYMEDLNNATQNYYNTLGETASLENSIVELMKKSAEEEVNSIKKIIDARKQALQKKKEYYDYDKSLKNSQKEIDSIKAQIAALEGLSDATDAATKAKLAQIKADLAEKEDALQETKDEYTYNLQIDALDEFTKTLEDALDESTKLVEEILREQKEIISSAKELSQASVGSTNKTIELLTAFYSGMGTSIDGVDLPTEVMDTVNDTNVIGADNTNTEEPINITDKFGDNEVAAAIKETTSAVKQFKQEAAAKFTELIISGELQQKLNSETLNTGNDFLSRINDNVSQINNYFNTREKA